MLKSAHIDKMVNVVHPGDKHAPLILWVMVLCILVGCHRSEFSSDLTTKCPEPNGALVVLDYTLNCLYVADTPIQGCPDALPNDYQYRGTYICSERSGASASFLQAGIDTYQDIDAAVIYSPTQDASVTSSLGDAEPPSESLNDGFLSED